MSFIRAKSAATPKFRFSISLLATFGLLFSLLAPWPASAIESSTPIDANPLPTAVAFSPDGRYAYIANNQLYAASRPGFVTKIDTRDNSIVATTPILANPLDPAFAQAYSSWIAVDPTGTFAYLPNGYGPIAVLDLIGNRFLKSFQTIYNSPSGVVNRERGTQQIVFHPTKRLAFIATNQSVTIVETVGHTAIGSIPIERIQAPSTVLTGASSVGSIALSKDGNSLIVAECRSSSTDSLQIFDVSNLTTTDINYSFTKAIRIYFPSNPTFLSNGVPVPYGYDAHLTLLNSDSTRAFIATGNTGIMMSINLVTGVLDEIPVAMGRGLFAISPDDRFLITTTESLSAVTIIDLTGRDPDRVVSVGQTPRSIAISPDSRFAFISNSDAHVGSISKVAITLTPEAPSQIVATGASSTSASINFTAPALNGEVVTGYEYSLDGGTTWIPVTPAVTAAPIVISGLTPGTTYTLRVHALSLSGAGESSANISVTTPAQVITPSVPDSVPVVTPEVVVPPVVEKIWIHKLPIFPKNMVKGKTLTVSAASSAKAFVTTRSLNTKICKVTKVTKLVKKPRTRAKVRITTGYKVSTKSTGTCLLKSSAPAIGLYPAVQLTSRLVVAKAAKK